MQRGHTSAALRRLAWITLQLASSAGAEWSGTGGGGKDVAAAAEGMAAFEVTDFKQRVYVSHLASRSSRLRETKRLGWRAMSNLTAS